MEEGREVGERGGRRRGKRGERGERDRGAEGRGFNESSFKHRASRRSSRQSSKPNHTLYSSLIQITSLDLQFNKHQRNTFYLIF